MSIDFDKNHIKPFDPNAIVTWTWSKGIVSEFSAGYLYHSFKHLNKIIKRGTIYEDDKKMLYIGHNTDKNTRILLEISLETGAIKTLIEHESFDFIDPFITNLALFSYDWNIYNMMIGDSQGIVTSDSQQSFKFKTEPHVHYIWFETYNGNEIATSVNSVTIKSVDNLDPNRPHVIGRISNGTLSLMPKATKQKNLKPNHILNTKGNRKKLRKMLQHIEIFTDMGHEKYYEYIFEGSKQKSARN